MNSYSNYNVNFPIDEWIKGLRNDASNVNLELKSSIDTSLCEHHNAILDRVFWPQRSAFRVKKFDCF